MNPSVLSHIAALSYENETDFRQKILQYTQPNAIHFFDASVNNLSDAQMYTLEYDDKLIFTIRGTSSFKDGLTDILVKKKLFEDVQYSNYVDQKKYKNIRVHSGFLQQYNTVKFNILAQIFKRLWTDTTKQVRIILTSHSLGAAIASLVAATVKAHFGYRVLVENITFGCPRVGNKSFVNFYEQNIDVSHRYINCNDIVTKMPKIGFSNFTNKIVLGHPEKSCCFRRKVGTINDHYMINYIRYLDSIDEHIVNGPVIETNHNIINFGLTQTITKMKISNIKHTFTNNDEPDNSLIVESITE